MNMKRILAFALALCMILTLAPVAPARAAESETLEIEKLDGSQINLELTKPSQLENLEAAVTVDPNEMVKVIILMEGQSVVEGNPKAVLNASTQKQMEDLEQKQMTVLAQIEQNVLDGKKLDVAYNYTWLINGVATTVPYGAIAEIKALDGVESVMIQQVYTVCETTNAVATPNTITDGA